MDQQKQGFNPVLAGLAALATLFFVFPLIGLVTGAPWGRMASVITTRTSLDALQLSIVASLSSTVIALLFGFPLAWLLARGQFRGKGVLRGLTTLPMVLPPVVGGIAVFRRVTLPLIWPSLAAGTVLTWARALGEFGATITFAGNLPGTTQTMPLAIYISQSSNRMAEAIALSLILVLVSLVVMIFRRERSSGD